MQRIIIGISGASGAIYGILAQEALKDVPDIETHLVLSSTAKRTIAEETDWKVSAVEALAHVVHTHSDIGASVASGSYITAGMIVAPCSIKTLSEIANSHNDNLMTRAADVCLKERRQLVVASARDAPSSWAHRVDGQSLQLRRRPPATGAGLLHSTADTRRHC